MRPSRRTERRRYPTVEQTVTLSLEPSRVAKCAELIDVRSYLLCFEQTVASPTSAHASEQ